MNEEATSWVVYLMPMNKKPSMKAVCEQSEWEAMELARPGFRTLIQAGIGTEGEAEKVARDEPEFVAKPRLKARHVS